MRIALDFDDTLTTDACLWRDFIQKAQELGHNVVCVTARRDTTDNLAHIMQWMESHGVGLPVYMTSLKSKVDYMQARGIDIDVWIDDNPKQCANGF